MQFEYRVDREKNECTAIVERCNQPDLIFPSEHEGMPVVRVSFSPIFIAAHIRRIFIPHTVCEIDKTICQFTRVEQVDIDADNPYFCAVDNIIYTKDMENVIYCANRTGTVTLPPSVKRIGKFAFYAKRGIESIELPEGLEIIEPNAFSYCLSLKQLVIPSTVLEMGDSICSGCTALEELVVRSLHIALNSTMFWICSSLKCITLPDGHEWNRTIGGILFSTDGQVLQMCPPSTKGIVEVPNGVRKISAKAFTYCDEITEIILPDTLEEIGECAFSFMDAIESVTIPDSVRSIDKRAFTCCRNLRKVHIGAGVEQMGQAVFENCGWLEHIEVSEGNGTYSANGQCLLSKDGSVLFCCTGNSEGRAVIPDGVRRIESNAFCRACGITEVVLPDSLQHISAMAFSGCIKLKNLHLPEDEIYIDPLAFHLVDELTISAPHDAEYYGYKPHIEVHWVVE